MDATSDTTTEPGVDETACRAVRREALLPHRMSLPHQISTLLFVFDREDRVLLLERTREPNRGLWSPPGGKLLTAEGESPYACACREAREELGLELRAPDLHLTGLISEHGYQDTAHWMMFLFEVRPRLEVAPGPIAEGRFAFFKPAQVNDLSLPQTDREQIWRLFWEHRGGFFAAHCRCETDGRHAWTLEESNQRRTSNVELRALESQHGTPHPHSFRRRGDT